MASTMRVSITSRPVVAAPRRARATASRGAVVVRAGDIIETAKAAGFTTLVAAVEAAGLTETLKSAGPFTVFAPTNEAFAALPAGTLDTLLKPESKKDLTDILLYHVLKGKNLSRHIVNAPSIPTLNPDGIKLTLDTKTGGKGVTRIGCKEVGKQGLNAEVIGGKITQADVAADNGLIHIIDAVLIPIAPPPPSNGGGYSFPA